MIVEGRMQLAVSHVSAKCPENGLRFNEEELTPPIDACIMRFRERHELDRYAVVDEAEPGMKRRHISPSGKPQQSRAGPPGQGTR